jgi:hypothetical protein
VNDHCKRELEQARAQNAVLIAQAEVKNQETLALS